MTDRHKPKPHSVPPAPGAEIRALHEKIQEAREVIRELKGTAIALNEITDQISEMRDSLVSELRDYMREMVGKQVEHVNNRLTVASEKLADNITERRVEINKRFDEIRDLQAGLLGVKDSKEMIQMVADMILRDVVEAIENRTQETGSDTGTVIIDLRSKPEVARRRYGKR